MRTLVVGAVVVAADVVDVALIVFVADVSEKVLYSLGEDFF